MCARTRGLIHPGLQRLKFTKDLYDNLLVIFALGWSAIVLVLFLGTFCALFFLPLEFHFRYSKFGWDDSLTYEMSFLGGLLRRTKAVSLLQPTPQAMKSRERLSGRWFFIHRSKTKTVTAPYNISSRGPREFLHRYSHYGLAITLLTYFLPAQFSHWLLVGEGLEHKGRFTKFHWATRIGTGDPALTALGYGIMWGIKTNLLSYLDSHYVFSERPQLEVVPDYQQPKWDMLFDCIFKVKIGYIIIASVAARFRLRMSAYKR